MRRVTVFDYGAGNLHSLAKALAAPGVDVRIETDPVAALDTDALVLPGVGAFGAAADRLAPGRAAMAAALEGGLPCLGICLGMQLLFDGSDEGGGAGLGVIPGRVTRLVAPRVPHIGWNAVESATDPLLSVAPLDVVYYAHSYICRPTDLTSVTAWTEEGGDRFPAAVRWRRTVGVQFHPEKSSSPGVRFVQAFVSTLA
ncbi:MAG TPA: imidazole glycerol phosphate synthase subunit HisH [Gemmatimonadaceae bacterium]|nr:imidazole glycerol phosphate synthase subunit HisH [Gemmatimonadaceae bacterium]